MRAEYDSEANAISIDLVEPMPRWDGNVEISDRCNVALAGDSPVNVEILYPDMGIDEPLRRVLRRFPLDGEALKVAAESAVGAPDRVVVLQLLTRAAPA